MPQKLFTQLLFSNCCVYEASCKVTLWGFVHCIGSHKQGCHPIKKLTCTISEWLRHAPKLRVSISSMQCVHHSMHIYTQMVTEQVQLAVLTLPNDMHFLSYFIEHPTTCTYPLASLYWTNLIHNGTMYTITASSCWYIGLMRI